MVDSVRATLCVSKAPDAGVAVAGEVNWVQHASIMPSSCGQQYPSSVAHPGLSLHSALSSGEAGKGGNA
eukprot:CAMPEP_0194537844 /NCGR_PEP_ID=MMETSP0253-20130528/77229_1 /TAXON_ID=2966 /ORGANISM="Noctiluca scintillans" /LENGTH=68 /DNA_ID=CAMNT_0039383897 /DNA_START=156 /DNA_END=362 /DNA_ORIENTATION=+